MKRILEIGSKLTALVPYIYVSMCPYIRNSKSHIGLCSNLIGIFIVHCFYIYLNAKVSQPFYIHLFLSMVHVRIF